jgi:hypothetical protein
MQMVADIDSLNLADLRSWAVLLPIYSTTNTLRMVTSVTISLLGFP